MFSYFMPYWMYLTFQDSVSSWMEEMVKFHDYMMVFIVLILVFVFYLLMLPWISHSFNLFTSEDHTIESIWTIIPAIVLIFISVPSMSLLYLFEDLEDCSMTIKIVGHQWYWSYEYSDLSGVSFDSFMEESNLTRVLKNSSPLVISTNLNIRLILTSADVIHSWALPATGVKLDAVPGRLNQSFIFSKFSSILMGQCSELCGANHSFMPITVIFLNMSSFLRLINLV